MNKNYSRLQPNLATTVYVCICNAVTDREIRQCADLGVQTLDQLRECLGVASCCGKCETTARALLGDPAHAPASHAHAG